MSKQAGRENYFFIEFTRSQLSLVWTEVQLVYNVLNLLEMEESK